MVFFQNGIINLKKCGGFSFKILTEMSIIMMNGTQKYGTQNICEKR
jgi:hypothetical protein